jgi:large subunit ribosomal protein L13
MTEKIIMDATDAVLGRLASHAAKQALLGKEIIITNCNDIIISGRKTSTIKEYEQSRARHSSSLKGPHFPKIPEKLVKRTIRGMLSYRQKRGSDALKRILCYNTVPPEYENSKKISLKNDPKLKSITLKKLSEKI